MKLSSTAFENNGTIPRKYTGDGGDVIPPLAISDVPIEAKSLALIMDDPDAPNADRNFDHWLLWNIPTTVSRIEEGKAPEGVVGKNSWGRNDYGGPSPPDREHRYFFKLFALDAILDLPPSSRKPQLLKAMEPHVIAKTELVGRYDRKR